MRRASWILALVLLALGVALAVLLSRGESTGPTGSAGTRHEPALVSEAPALQGSPRARDPDDLAFDANAPPRASDEAGTADDAQDDDAPLPPWWPPDTKAIPLRVEFVDALTGAPLEGAWRVHVPTAAPEPPPPAVPSPRGPPRLPIDARVRRAGQTAAVARDERVAPQIVVLGGIPSGYVHWTSEARDVELAEGARELVRRVPLHRALTLQLTVLGPQALPARGARLTSIYVAGVEHPAGPGTVDEAGRLEVGGIPFLPGAAVDAYVSWPSEEEDDGEPPALDEPASLTFEIPRALPVALVQVLRLPGRTRGIRDRMEVVDFDPAYRLGDVSEVRTPAEATGAVRVTALGRDGVALAGARLCCGADCVDAPRGEALFEEVSAGVAVVVMRASGRLPASAMVRVSAGVEERVTLREPEGGRLEVRVTDANGRALPAARLQVATPSDAPVFDVVDGVQRVDLVVDARGERSIERVAPGPVTVIATWGEWRGAARVDLRDRATEQVDVVVRPP